MKQLLLFLLLIITGVFQAWSQEKQYGQIKGLLKDKDTQEPLIGASVTLLHAMDSSRLTAALTNKKGAFIIEKVPEGEYRLYITYLGYQSLFLPVGIIANNKVAALGGIFLEKTGLTLEEVQIIGIRSPLVVKKDTLEFDAAYFKTRENALMEELLKKLPGVQIARDGTITVNGEIVKRILVDSKPFFEDNPKLALRNLTADMIDRIQLVSGNSDHTQFPGSYSGKKPKEINITIRKDRKKSFSGRAVAGYGTDERFTAGGNLNRFDDEQQIAVLANGNNVNSSQDGEGINMAGNGNGIARNWNAGINYSKSFSKKLRVHGSYVINDNHVENQRNSARQNLLPDTTYYYNQQAQSQNNQTDHTLHTLIHYTIDSMHTLTVNTNFKHAISQNLRTSLYKSLSGGQQLVNSGAIHNNSTRRTPMLSTFIGLEKKFRKQGRTLSTNLFINYSDNIEEQFNLSHNLFAQSNGGAYTDTIDQRNDISSKGHKTYLRLLYKEPLFKDHFLQLIYIYTRDNNTSGKFTYDYNAAKRAYDRLNDSLSNSFESIIYSHRAVAGIHGQKDKYNYRVDLALQINNLNNKNLTLHNRFKKSVANFFPGASFGYVFTDNKHLNFFYSTGVELPNVIQLQPVPDNSNPLYIQLGNPDLKPASSHNFNLTYDATKVAAMRHFVVNTTVELYNNRIVNANWFDSLGRQVTQPVNMHGAYNIKSNITNSFPLKKLQTSINANTALMLNRDISLINGVKGYVKNFGVKQDLSFNYAYRELFDFSTEAGISYNGVRYSVQKDNNTNFFSYNFSFDYNLNLPLGFIIGGQLDYLLNTGRIAGYNLDVTMLNAFISKSVFKHKQGLIKLQGFDLLKQNISISRNVGENYIEDVQTNVLQRFFMISFSYFLKKGK